MRSLAWLKTCRRYTRLELHQRSSGCLLRSEAFTRLGVKATNFLIVKTHQRNHLSSVRYTLRISGATQYGLFRNSILMRKSSLCNVCAFTAETLLRHGVDDLSVEVVCSHQQLKTKLGGKFHVWYVLRMLILLVIIEVLANLLEDDTVYVFEFASTSLGLSKVV